MIETPRTRLYPWSERHRAAFAAMHGDAEVMWDYGGPIDPGTSFEKLARYIAAYDRLGFCRWALENSGGELIGYVGVMPSPPNHPLGAHFDIGWRLVRRAWGFGYATEAARAALMDFFARNRAAEVLSYTAPDNLRSQAVMERLNLRRDSARDFVAQYRTLQWRGLVWVADRTVARQLPRHGGHA
jgi:RimJ/RimL family protein N-acetyltransferase